MPRPRRSTELEAAHGSETSRTRPRTERIMADKRPALGRGLSALIPAPRRRRRPRRHARVAGRPAELDIDLLTPNPRQPRMQMDEARARRARAVDPQPRRDSADSRAPRRRPDRDRRGRAPLARRAARGPAQGPGRVSRRADDTAARGRADRKHPARRSESDRRSAGVPAARRRASSCRRKPSPRPSARIARPSPTTCGC